MNLLSILDSPWFSFSLGPGLILIGAIYARRNRHGVLPKFVFFANLIGGLIIIFNGLRQLHIL